MLFHQRNQTDVAARTQQPGASCLGKLVAVYVMMVMASRAAPNQSHCCWASGSSSFISPSPSALRVAAVNRGGAKQLYAREIS